MHESTRLVTLGNALILTILESSAVAVEMQKFLFAIPKEPPISDSDEAFWLSIDALNLAKACRKAVITEWQVSLGELPELTIQ